MKDKVQKIQEEVERLKEIAEYNLSHSKMDRSAWMQQASVCTNLLSFIDSIQKEPINDDIEKAVDEYLSTYFGSEQEKQNWPFLKKIAMYFVAWQKQQMMKDAICTYMSEDDCGDIVPVLANQDRFKVGDKVKVIIIKED